MDEEIKREILEELIELIRDTPIEEQDGPYIKYSDAGETADRILEMFIDRGF